MKPSRRTVIITASAFVVAAGLGGAAFAVNQPGAPVAVPTHSASAATPSPSTGPTTSPYTAPSAAAIAALPEAQYNTVIPGLLGYKHAGVPKGLTAVYTIAADAPLYGQDHTTPVARLAAKNFLGTNTIVVPVQTHDGWSLVLTPSRQTLPSANPEAPAQTAAWLRTNLLTKTQELTSHIVISVGKQTVSVQTPTPTGVVGYVQARYLDPAQDQTLYPITLTSLHSAAADEPFGGTDGGLIGVHYFSARTGAISHGCVRVSGEVITALDTLPLGTPIVIEP